jgi:DNA-directed RNA polymerase III subunit RPC7
MQRANLPARTEKEHFPKELWDVIDPKSESDNPDARKKTLKINTKSTRDKLADFDDADDAENEAENEAAEKKNPDDDEIEEIEDDEFDEDENDDMADDYNAERYFEDGEEDYEDGGGGGDDDGDGY